MPEEPPEESGWRESGQVELLPEESPPVKRPLQEPSPWGLQWPKSGPPEAPPALRRQPEQPQDVQRSRESWLCGLPPWDA